MPNFMFLALVVCQLSLPNQKLKKNLLCTFHEKITLTEVMYISKVCDHMSFQNLKVCGAAFAPTLQF